MKVATKRMKIQCILLKLTEKENERGQLDQSFIGQKSFCKIKSIINKMIKNQNNMRNIVNVTDKTHNLNINSLTLDF